MSNTGKPGVFAINRFWAIFRAGFLQLWSEPMPVAILTVFPILLILVLGNALSGVMSADGDVEAVMAAYVSQERESPLYALLTGQDASRYVEIVACSEAEADEMLASGECAAAVIERAGGEVEVRTPGEGGRGTSVILSLVDGYRRVYAAAVIAAGNGADPSAALSSDIGVETVSLGGRAQSATDYYAITMLVMILLYTGMNGMSLFNKNMRGEFGMRLQASPASRATVVTATVAASTAVSFLQGLVTFAFSAAVYGVNWGDNIPLILLTLFLLTLFSQLLCIFFLLLFGGDAAATGFAQAFIWISTFISKGYVKFDMGDAEKVFAYAPNALAHTVIFGAVYGGDWAVMARSLLILCGAALALGAGSFMLGRRRLA